MPGIFVGGYNPVTLHGCLALVCWESRVCFAVCQGAVTAALLWRRWDSAAAIRVWDWQLMQCTFQALQGLLLV